MKNGIASENRGNLADEPEKGNEISRCVAMAIDGKVLQTQRMVLSLSITNEIRQPRHLTSCLARQTGRQAALWEHAVLAMRIRGPSFLMHAAAAFPGVHGENKGKERKK